MKKLRSSLFLRVLYLVLQDSLVWFQISTGFFKFLPWPVKNEHALLLGTYFTRLVGSTPQNNPARETRQATQYYYAALSRRCTRRKAVVVGFVIAVAIALLLPSSYFCLFLMFMSIVVWHCLFLFCCVLFVVVVVVVVVVVPAKSASGSALGTLWKSRPNFLVAKTSCLDFGSLSSLFFTWQLQATPLGFWMSDVEFWESQTTPVHGSLEYSTCYCTPQNKVNTCAWLDYSNSHSPLPTAATVFHAKCREDVL